MRTILAPALAAALTTALLVALGLWQLDRRAWKRDLVYRAETRSVSEAVDIPDPSTWDSFDSDEIDYARVRVSGRFRHNAEVHLYANLSHPKGKFGGPGFFVFTPLERNDGTFVFVNRGFVPLRNKSPTSRMEGQVSGPVVIEGIARRPQRRSWFTPADDVAQNVWFTRDADAFAVARGLPEAKVAPFTVDADAAATPPGGLPQAGETVLHFSDNHLQYALTWFGLAVACLAMFVAFARARLTGEGAEGATAPPRRAAGPR